MVTTVGVVHLFPCRAVEIDLPCERTGPDDDGGDRNERQADEASRPPSVREAIENEEADDQSTDNGAGTFERAI